MAAVPVGANETVEIALKRFELFDVDGLHVGIAQQFHLDVEVACIGDGQSVGAENARLLLRNLQHKLESLFRGGRNLGLKGQIDLDGTCALHSTSGHRHPGLHALEACDGNVQLNVRLSLHVRGFQSR